MESNWCTYYAMWQHFFEFSDKILGNDNLSVYVQGSYGPYEGSRLQREMIDD